MARPWSNKGGVRHRVAARTTAIRRRVAWLVVQTAVLGRRRRALGFGGPPPRRSAWRRGSDCAGRASGLSRAPLRAGCQRGAKTTTCPFFELFGSRRETRATRARARRDPPRGSDLRDGISPVVAVERRDVGRRRGSCPRFALAPAGDGGGARGSASADGRPRGGRGDARRPRLARLPASPSRGRRGRGRDQRPVRRPDGVPS